MTDPAIAYEKHRLPNGLEVLLHRDDAAPVVAVNVWYHVGSKDERPNATGFAHLFEHLMFQGSRHYPGDYIAALQELGADVNGGTTYDRTSYHEVIPAGSLERVLAMESDRMGYLLDALSETKLATQKDVVINEYRQQYANRPYGLTWAWLAESLYPADHPYSWMPIGRPEHVAASDRDQVAAFFKTWYTPDNASVCLSGAIDPPAALEMVARWFGELPGGAGRPAVTVPAVEAPAEDQIVRRGDRVSQSRLHLVWHTVAQLEADDAELEVASDILSRGKSSRLVRRLVYQDQLAQGVVAEHWSRALGGLFCIVATAKPGGELDRLRAVVDDELHRLAQTPPTEEEMTRVWNRREAGFIYAAQSVLGKAERLSAYNSRTGNPGYLAADMARYRRVTAADVSRVVGQYLSGRRRVEMRIEPASAVTASVPGTVSLPTGSMTTSAMLAAG